MHEFAACGAKHLVLTTNLISMIMSHYIRFYLAMGLVLETLLVGWMKQEAVLGKPTWQ